METKGKYPKQISVYKLTNSVNNSFYVGSTGSRLCKRIGQHREACNRGDTSLLYKLMKEIGVDKWIITLIETHTVNSFEEQRKFEREIADILKPDLNMVRAYSSPEEDKQRDREYMRSICNTDEYKQYQKFYRQTEAYKQYKRAYEKTEKAKQHHKNYRKTERAIENYKMKQKEYYRTEMGQEARERARKKQDEIIKSGKFSCQCCEYTSPTKTMLERHCNSNKHNENILWDID